MGSEQPPKFVFRKVVRGAQKTQLQSSSSSDSDPESAVSKATAATAEKRRKAVMASAQTTAGFAKKMKKGQESNSDASSDEGKEDPQLVSTTYKANELAKRSGPDDSGATRSLEIDTETDRDAIAVGKRAIEMAKKLKEKPEDDKTYKGLNNYQQFYQKKDSVIGNAGSGLNARGPVRASGNVRATVRWDYEPCICKDWKETGYCGFGDSCKFLHDRSDYKMGWQIEREIETGTYQADQSQSHQRYVIESSGESDGGDDDLPFRCLICRETFNTPVVSKCQHYFCEQCALDFYRKKSTRCFVCGEQTYGIFNPAVAIIKKLKKLAEREAAEGIVSTSEETDGDKLKPIGNSETAPEDPDDDDDDDE